MKNILKKSNKKINKLAILFAYAGTIPFIFSSLYVWLIENTEILKISNVIVIYSYIILTFIGGIYWGLGINSNNTKDSLKYYSYSIAPALICWFLYLLNFINLVNIILIIFFLNLSLLIEKFLISNNKKLDWYLLLRVRLNFIVTISLLVFLLKVIYL